MLNCTVFSFLSITNLSSILLPMALLPLFFFSTTARYKRFLYSKRSYVTVSSPSDRVGHRPECRTSVLKKLLHSIQMIHLGVSRKKLLVQSTYVLYLKMALTISVWIDLVVLVKVHIHIIPMIHQDSSIFYSSRAISRTVIE